MGRERIAVGAALGGLGAAAWVQHAWVTDDAFFTFRTVRHLLAGQGPVWNVGERVQVYTHPLWMLLEAVTSTVTGGDPARAAWLLSLGLTVGSLVLLAARLPPVVATAASLALLSSRSVLDYTSSGLEGPLALLLTLATVAAPRTPPSRAVGLLALATSALALTRPEAALLPLPALAWATWRGGRATLPALAAGLLPLALWSAFALVYYGTPLPNTYYAKVPTGDASVVLAQHGQVYVERSLRWDPIGAGLLVAGLLAALAGDARARALGLGAVLVIAWVGRVGDYMAGRMLLVPIAAAVGLVAERARHLALPAWPAALLLALHLPFAAGWFPTLGRPPRPCERVCLDDERDRDARPGIAWSFRIDGPVRPEQPPVVGRLRTVVVTEVSGAYADQSDQHVVDVAALGDALLSRLPVRFPAVIPGHWNREIPEGYLAALADGDPDEVVDPELRVLAHHVDRVVRGPLWTWERWRSIAVLARPRPGSPQP